MSNMTNQQDPWAFALSLGAFEEGISVRSKYRISARLHLILDMGGEWVIWCGGSPALREQTVQPRYCPKCAALAREQMEDLADD